MAQNPKYSVGFTVDRETYEALVAFADKHHRSIAQIVRDALVAHVKEGK